MLNGFCWFLFYAKHLRSAKSDRPSAHGCVKNLTKKRTFNDLVGFPIQLIAHFKLVSTLDCREILMAFFMSYKKLHKNATKSHKKKLFSHKKFVSTKIEVLFYVIFCPFDMKPTAMRKILGTDY